MLIRLKTTYYHYCEIDAATVRGLQAAGSQDAPHPEEVSTVGCHATDASGRQQSTLKACLRTQLAFGPTRSAVASDYLRCGQT